MVLAVLLQELSRLQKLVQLPSIQEALKEKFSKFDADLNPTHDQEGKELDTKVCLPRCACALQQSLHVGATVSACWSNSQKSGTSLPLCITSVSACCRNSQKVKLLSLEIGSG